MMYNDEFENFRKLIAPDEHVLWKGKPDEGLQLSSGDYFMIPFSLLWCGFAIFWEFMAITGGAPFFFCLFGIPFVCIGCYMVFGRFIWSAYVQKRTMYVITNKKIIRKRGNKIDFLNASAMPPMHTVVHKNGNISIYFLTHNLRYRGGNASFMSTGMDHGQFSLLNISDFSRVEYAINNMDK